MPDVIKFERNTTFLSAGSAIGIEITATKDPKVAEALVTNQPFPPGDVRLGDISVSGEAGKDITFGGKKGKVGFKASAEAHAGLGVFFDPNELLDSLDLSDNISPAMDLKPDPDSIYMLLNWGYDLSASAKGSIALGANPLTITFGGEAQRTAAYGVIRKMNRTTGALDAVKETVNSWVLPTQVTSLDQLPPGTWLIAEVDGSVAFNLGATFGYDFNWMRETRLGGLSGDIGLRIQSGIKVALGFEASGKYALVIARESTDAATQKVRVRLFRQRKRGWSFSFDANASIQAKNELLPEELDDFIAGVFGTHGAQIVKDFALIAETDPAKLLAGLSSEYLKKFLGSITALTDLHLPERLAQARQQLLDMVKRWNNLDHEIVTVLMKFADKHSEIEKIREIAGFINDTSDTQKIKSKIKEILEDVDFFDRPEAKWLESATATGLASLLASDDLDELRKAAGKTLSLLNGSDIQKVFERLQEFINKNIHLSQIEHIISQADFDNLDELLKKRLEKFLGETIDFTKFKELQKAIQKVRAKAQEFYKAGLKALTSKYTFAFSATYQKTTTRSALFDIDFDFATPGVGNSLQEAVDGNFDGLMVEQRTGVKLNVATLTHEIKRNTHVELTMPFFGKKEMDHLNESVATVNATDDDGRVLVFGLEAKDVVSTKNQRNSTVTLAGAFQVKPSSNVRVFSEASLDYSYSLRTAKKNMKAADLKYQLKSYMDSDGRSPVPLLKDVFSADDDGGLTGSFDRWFADIDTTVENVLHNKADVFGNTLLSLQIGVGPKVTKAWMKASKEDSSPRYLDMSRRLQAKLKQLVPFIYFQKLDRFKTKPSAAALLVYSAIPPSTQITLSGDKLTLDVATDIYWDHLDPQKVRAMMHNERTRSRLTVHLTGIFEALSKTEGFKDVAKDYQPTSGNITQILDFAGAGVGSANLHALLKNESETVDAARETGKKFAKFEEVAATEPSKAVKLLAEFGSKFTDTFNNELGGLHGGFNARPLGTLLLIEAALALDVNLTPKDTDMSSILELIVLKDSSTFKMEEYINGVVPKKEECVLQQRIVSIGD